MGFHFSIHTIPLVFSALMTLAVIMYAFRYRQLTAVPEFMACMCCGLIWSAANALELAGNDLDTKLFWANLQYLSYAFSPVAWLFFSLKIAGKRTLSPWRWLLLVLPVATSVLVWLDPWLGFVRTDFELVAIGDLSIIGKSYGPWFRIHSVYSYFFNTASAAILGMEVLRKGSLYRIRAMLILSGLLTIFAVNIAYILGAAPVQGYDITPSLFGLLSVLVWWAILKYRFLEIVPVAREKVLETMPYGILVCDGSGLVIDANRTARSLFGCDKPIGQPIDRILKSVSAGNLSLNGSGRHEITTNLMDTERVLEIEVSAIDESRKDIAGSVLLVRDTSELTRAREALGRQSNALAVAEERERLSRELHDNLGQILSFAVIQIETIRNEMKNDHLEKVRMHLDTLSGTVKSAHHDLRDFVHDLRQTEYQTMRMAELVKREAGAFHTATGIRVGKRIVEGDFEASLSGERKRQLMCILKEALNNVAKHAGATAVSIEFAPQDGAWVFSIHDNGCGLAKNPAGQGAGLAIVHERTALVGGELHLTSGPGTTLSIVFRNDREQT